MNNEELLKQITAMMEATTAKFEARFQQLERATQTEFDQELQRIDKVEKEEEAHNADLSGKAVYLFEQAEGIKKELVKEEDEIKHIKEELHADEERIEELVKHDAQHRVNENKLLESQISLEQKQLNMERDVHIEMERLKNLLVANNIDHETGKRLQHNLEEIQEKEDILAQDMAKIKAQERESYDNQVFLRDSMEDIRQEMENMRLEAAQNKKFNENLKFELQNLAQQARPIGRSQGPADNSGVPNYPDVNVDIPNKDVIFQNIRIYLPEVFTAQKIPQLQVSGALLKYNSAKDAQLSTISNMLKDIQFTEDDSIQQRIVYMMRIQTILRNQTNSVDDWKFAIESFSCTEVMDQLQESDPKDYNGLLVALFDQYEFHAYGKTKIKELTTFNLNNPYMKPFYSSWIRKYKKYQTFASEVFHTIKKRIVADLEAAKKPELVEQVTTIVTVQKLLQFVQLNTGSILRMALSNNSDELMAIRSKPVYKLQNYSEKGKRLGYCTDCKCLKCKKKRTMKNLVFNKKVNFCRNCSCSTCNKNSKQYDDTKRKSIAKVNSVDVVDFEDSDLDSEVDEDNDYSTSDTAVVSGNEDSVGMFQGEFEYINSLDGEARPI